MTKTERILDLAEELARLVEVIQEHTESLRDLPDSEGLAALIQGIAATEGATVRTRTIEVTDELHHLLKYLTGRSVMSTPEIAESPLPDAISSIRGSLRALRGHLRRMSPVYDAIEEGQLVEQQKSLLLKLERLSGSFSSGLSALQDAAKDVAAAPKGPFTVRRVTQLADAGLYSVEMHVPCDGVDSVTLSALDMFGLVMNWATRRISWQPGEIVDFRIPDIDTRNIASVQMRFGARTA